MKHLRLKGVGEHEMAQAVAKEMFPEVRGRANRRLENENKGST
jgi:hypothetical protein